MSPQFHIHVQEDGNEPVADPAGDIAEIWGAPRQSQVQYHESDEPLATGAAEGAAELCGWLLVVGATGVFSAAAAVESGVTDPPETLTWVTEPLSPGLSMRTLTLMFAETGGGVAGGGAAVEVVEGFA